MAIATPDHQRSVDALKEARKSLDAARYELGNDHPAYDALVEMIRQTYDIEGLY